MRRLVTKLHLDKIVDHCDVVGASPVGTPPTTFSFSTDRGWFKIGIPIKKLNRSYDRHISRNGFPILVSHLYIEFLSLISLGRMGELKQARSVLPYMVINQVYIMDLDHQWLW